MSPHLHCRFELLAPLGNPTEKKCSNLLIGVENTAGDVCCEDQCEICGGKGCGQRPGGSVRWCLDIFVSCPLVSRAFGESRSFGCPGPWKRGKCSRHRSHNQTFGYRFAGKRALLSPPPDIGKFDEQVIRAYYVFDTIVEARCLRDEEVSLNHDDF